MNPTEAIITVAGIVIGGIFFSKGFNLLAKYIPDKGLVTWIMFFIITGLIFSTVYLSSNNIPYAFILSGIALVVIMNIIQKAYGW